MVVFVTGVIVLGCVIGLFWLKDLLQSPALARLAHSELTARLALVGAALTIIGALLILKDLSGYWPG